MQAVNNQDGGEMTRNSTETMQGTEDQGYVDDQMCTSFYFGEYVGDFLRSLCWREFKICFAFLSHSHDHSRSSDGASNQENATWFSGWFSWCPTSERLLEIAESQILESKTEILLSCLCSVHLC